VKAKKTIPMAREVQEVYEWYCALGEPLNRELSLQKFRRFLRDTGLWRSEVGEKAKSKMASTYSTTSVGTTATAATAPSPVKLGRELPLPNYPEPQLSSVDVDLLFFQGLGGAGANHKSSQMSLKGFQESCLEIAQRCHDEADDERKYGAFVHVLRDLLGVLVDKAELLTTSHVPKMSAVVGELTAELLEHQYDSLTKLWEAYQRKLNPADKKRPDVTKGRWGGWSLKEWVQMTTDFGLTDLLKPLVLRRIFFVHAAPWSDTNQDTDNVNLEGDREYVLGDMDVFLDALVLVAERMQYADNLENNRDRLLWLLYHLNSEAFSTRLSHLRPLFPNLPPKPKIKEPDSGPVGWQRVLSLLSPEDQSSLSSTKALKKLEAKRARDREARTPSRPVGAEPGFGQLDGVHKLPVKAGR
jgi:hypothetical protein